MIDFQTALQMRDLGFPQPEPKFGQMWWLFTLSGQRLVLITQVNGTSLNASSEHGAFEYDETDFSEMPHVYCPTITDIMRELGHEYDFGFSERSDFSATFWVAGPHKMYLDAEAEKAGATAWIEKQQGIRV